MNNTLGIDANIFSPDNSTFDYLSHGDTNAIIRIYTGGETVITQVVTTAIDLNDPTFESEPILSGIVGQNYSYLVIASNIDNTNLSFSSTNIPSWLTLIDNGDNTAILSGIPNAIGNYSIEINVGDENGGSTTQNFIITVSENNSEPCQTIYYTDTRTTCDSLVWVDGVTYRSNNNTANYTYITDEGCDSIVTLDLTIKNWNLVWSDEFDVDGAIDNSKWYHQTFMPNGWGWYNGELQHYTDRTDNSYVQDGNLHIVAKSETYTDPVQGITKEYTSARLNSKFAFTYGRVEARAKLPFGIGTWPAIWTLGKNINETGAYWQTQGYGTTNWPACGEIDIMEHWGTNQNYVKCALHTPSSNGNTVNQAGIMVEDVENTFHLYAM